MNNKELSVYLNGAIERLVSGIIKTTIGNSKQTFFVLKYAESVKHAQKKREALEKEGQHVPSFLISSIANSCNLFCTGCYARANGNCDNNNNKQELLSPQQWNNIFSQAKDMGITFSLLAGGEPLLRKDVIEQAAQFKEILFPIFTNGTLIDENYITLFDKNRNLIPILSIEGEESHTDERRGTGTYKTVINIMDTLQKAKLIFGVSITVTKENLSTVTSQEFVHDLYQKGCKAIFFIEYVPIDNTTEHLTLSDELIIQLEQQQTLLRKNFEHMIFLSFPGDEKFMGGCLAAGRGFFHISPYGAAEACPFSPYSDCNLKTHTLKQVINSPFFKRLQDSNLVGGEHNGGCTLFQNESMVKHLLNS